VGELSGVGDEFDFSNPASSTVKATTAIGRVPGRAPPVAAMAALSLAVVTGFALLLTVASIRVFSRSAVS
jgi:hypothetical protein